jgi:beta-glucosidase/6-phospho-beta-glucosidase/beta-galactosidase
VPAWRLAQSHVLCSRAHRAHLVSLQVACDHYHRWQEDIQLMQQLGLKHYRCAFAGTLCVLNLLGAKTASTSSSHVQLCDAIR